MGKLTGKVAIVAGASKGIGAAIAKHLAAYGAAVIVNYSSSNEGADGVVAENRERRWKSACREGEYSEEGRNRTSLRRDEKGVRQARHSPQQCRHL